MANMILSNAYGSVDISSALLEYSRDIETNYYYDVETIDGKIHKSIRSQHEKLNLTLGNDKWNGNQKVLNTALSWITTQQELKRPINITVDDNACGECFVEIDSMSVQRLDKNGLFDYDMLQLTITLKESGVIV